LAPAERAAESFPWEETYKPWIFEFFTAPGAPGVDVTPPAVTEHYNWYLDLWQKAEGRGFGGIFFSECLL